MIDTNDLRKTPDALRQALQNRGGGALPDFEKLIEIDQVYRKLLSEIETLRSQKNALSQEFGKAKASGDAKGVEELGLKASDVKARLENLEKDIVQKESERRGLLLRIPNPPHESVPIGKSEQENKVIREEGQKTSFDFKPLDHQALGEKLGILDFAAAAKISGSRFALWRGAGSKLMRALTAYILDLHIQKHGYLEITPPALVRPEILEGTGQLPKFEQDLYKTQGNEKGQDLYLIPTAEVPLTNLVRDEILQSQKLPLKFTAYTSCFRQEAGSYGKDVRGLIRNHQFDKVELVWVTEPEKSLEALETLTHEAEAVLASLGIPYRVLALCTGDMGFSSRKTYDIEVWMPSESRYREISSCSDCGSFQARRMNARFKTDSKSAAAFVHTLNGSGVAIGRLFAAVLENFQTKTGTIQIPKPLVPYFGADVIS